jgi:pyrimidine-nucleoside phosphorylase
MNPLEWIESKKHGGAHTREVIEAIVDGATSGAIPDYQLAAWLMAVWHHGLSPEEMLWMTEAMRDSGTVFEHPAALGPTADKHSTGGVGDKASLVVAPLAAELGLCVPMLSGRGLGHTGGTLDKLQSIPGYRVDLDAAGFRKVLEDVGCSIMGQTADITPADRRLYALRDVTGTVDCQGLIVSSILSKKLAAGPRSLVIDLKCGSGAFMRDRESARELASALIGTGRAAGLSVAALVTDMDQPLGEAIGNAVEVVEALDCARGSGPEDLRELCVELVAVMAHLAGLGGPEQMRERCDEVLASGAVESRLRRMIVAHGGLEDFEAALPKAPEQAPATAARSGFVGAMATDEIGRALIDLGGGRLRHTDHIDPAAGLRACVRLGDRVEAGQPLFRIEVTDPDRAQRARERITRAVTIADEAPSSRSVLLERIEA